MADPRPPVGLTERLARWPARRWKLIAAAAGLLGGSLVGMAAYGLAGSTGVLLWTVAGVLFGAAASSGGVLALYVVLKQHRRLRETESQLRALINVRPLTRSLPLDLGEWAADPVLADQIVRALATRRPRRVVECGSGWSTVLTACCLRELGEGRVVALEHLKRFADRTRALLERYGVADRAEVLNVPIKEVSVEGETWPWYGIDPLEVSDGPVDVLVVDGPPGGLAPRSRYPAVPRFTAQLAQEWVILLDDGHREDEAWIAGQWARRLDVDPTFEPAGQGIFVFASPPATDRSGGPRDDGPPV